MNKKRLDEIEKDLERSYNEDLISTFWYDIIKEFIKEIREIEKTGFIRRIR